MATPASLSGERITLMRQWLADCESSHSQCNNNPKFFYDFYRRPPKRFIEVGELGKTDSCHLVELDTIPSKPYAALSYCWGPTEVNYTTTASRLEEHKRQLPWDRLPKTVQDAILVTQALAIPYLWVDALCIVQRSEVQSSNGVIVDNGDWAEEASKMAGLYRNAQVTLAAMTSSSSAQGFLTDTRSNPQPDALTRNDYFDLYDELQDTVHASRGWTFQEILLSTRIIHFYKGWMIWECRSAKGVEGKPLKDTTQGIFVKEQRDVVLRTLPNSNRLTWWSWVYTYTSRTLGHISDRPAAIHGVIDHYSYRVEDERMTGLWKSSLLQDLLWQVVKPGNRISTAIKMPTWSWLSIDAVINNPRNVALGNSIFIPTAKIVETRDFLSFTSNPHSWIGSSTIVLQGTLQPAKVFKEGDKPHTVQVIVNGEAHEPQHCWIDCVDDLPADGRVFCFWLGFLFGYPGLEQYATRECLLLIPAGNSTYHRVGVCKVRAEKLFKGTEITRKGGTTSDGMVGIKFAEIDEENEWKLGFVSEDVTITLR